MRLRGTLAVAFCAQALAQQWAYVDGPFGAGRGVAFDIARARAVVFGSEGETWEFAGTTRLHRPTTVAPFARSGHALVYDQARGNVLLFGGFADFPLGDTWLWDGCTWQQPFTLISPPRRNDAAIAYDSARNRVVLFGGVDANNGTLNDTWEWDGAQWLQRTPTTIPYPAGKPQMAFDAARNVTVLVTTSGISTPMAVFEWNGTDWVQRTSTVSPLPGHSCTMCYDPLRQRTVLFGGVVNGNELWEWDGTVWQRRLTNAPLAPLYPGMYFDPGRGATVIIGGREPGWRTAMWSWNGSTFANIAPDHSPIQRLRQSVFHDSARNRTVMFGGLDGLASPMNDTWEWDGQRWLLRAPATVPPTRAQAMSCFDPVTGTGLLLGGMAGTTVFADCWRYDGTNWSQLTVTVPTPRTDGAMVWDSARGEAILFGGVTGVPTTQLADTWRWNGTAWTQVATSTAPSPRMLHAMAFDPVSSHVVLFGSDTLNDTWEWDGAMWQIINTPQSPPVMRGVSMIHDPVRARMLLVGLNSITATVFDLEVWEYDGANWTHVSTSPTVLSLTRHLVRDGMRNRPVLIDGYTVRELTPTPAGVDPVGIGCGAPPPLLSARTRPRTGDGLFGLELQTRANLPVLFALGFGQGNTPLGNGCTLLIQQVGASAFQLANGSGMATLPVPLPDNYALRGLVVYAQAGALDATAPGGIAVSHGLRLTVGD